jgi:predicted ester cyclase
MDWLDKRDLEGVIELCGPDSVWHGFAPEPLGLDGYRQAISVFLDAFPDSRFPAEDGAAEGNLVANHHSLRGTHHSNFGETPPSGNPVTVNAIAIFRVEGGKIAETWLSADMLGLMQQIGAIPAPEAAAA